MRNLELQKLLTALMMSGVLNACNDALPLKEVDISSDNSANHSTTTTSSKGTAAIPLNSLDKVFRFGDVQKSSRITGWRSMPGVTSFNALYPGEFISTKLTVSTIGYYKIVFSGAYKGTRGGTFTIQLNGQANLQTMTFPVSETWNSFVSFESQSFQLTTGEHQLVLRFISSGTNGGVSGALDSFKLISGQAPVDTPAPVPVPIPAPAPTPAPAPVLPAFIKVMPMGDSNTEGFGQPAVGYRKSLKEKITALGINSDFVGSKRMGCNVFSDCEHEGLGRMGLDYVLERVNARVIATQKPDFLLLLIGPNDFASRTTHVIISDAETQVLIRKLAQVIDEVHRQNPHTHIIVAKPGTGTYAPRPKMLYRNGIDAIVSERISANRKISKVDFEDVPNDGVHYTPAGYILIADKWLRAMRDTF